MNRTLYLFFVAGLVMGLAAVAFARTTYTDQLNATKVCAKDGTGCVTTPVNNPTQICSSTGGACVSTPLPFQQWGRSQLVSAAFDAGLTGFAQDGGLIVCNCTLAAKDGGEIVSCDAVGGLWVVGATNTASSSNFINWKCTGYGN